MAAVASSMALVLTVLAAPVAGRTVPTGTESAAATSASTSPPRSAPARSCRGHRATIVGDARANRILGTEGRDVIWAGRGADTIAALGGRDLVCGGPGADALDGNAGRDTLDGSRGRDMCSGGGREHRRHHRCEVHLDIFGYQVEPPGAPDAGDRTGPRAQVAPAADVPDTLRGTGAYFASDAPLCAPDGIAYTTVHLGKVYFKTYYTNPGYIAIRPAYFRLGNSGFMQGPFYDGGWSTFYAPADNTVYQAEMFGRIVPRNDRVLWIYEVFWWDGFSWTNSTKVAVPGHYLQTTTGPLFTGAFCWV